MNLGMHWQGQTWYDNLLPEDFYPKGVKYETDGNPIPSPDDEDYLDPDDDYDYFEEKGALATN